MKREKVWACLDVCFIDNLTCSNLRSGQVLVPKIRVRDHGHVPFVPCLVPVLKPDVHPCHCLHILLRIGQLVLSKQRFLR